MHRMMSTTTTSTQKLLFVAVIFQNTVDEDDAGDDGNDTDRREINAVNQRRCDSNSIFSACTSLQNPRD